MELQRNHTSHIGACDDQRKTTAVAQQAERAAQKHTDGSDGERTPFSHANHGTAGHTYGFQTCQTLPTSAGPGLSVT